MYICIYIYLDQTCIIPVTFDMLNLPLKES